MTVKTLPVGPLGTNCYLLADEENHAAVIDPGGNGDRIAAALREAGLQPAFILLTHGHFDHVLGVPELLAEYPDLPVYITETDYPEARDGGRFPYKMGPVEGIRFYDEGDVLSLGKHQIQVLRTPGHTPGSVTLKVDDLLFTGDTLFAGSCGRTDLPGGSPRDMMASLRRLAALEGDYHVYPGHERSTTLDWERKHNYFMDF